MSFFNYFDLQITKHFGRILFIFVPENATKSNKKATKSPKFLIFKTYEEIIKDIEKLEHIVKFYPVMLLETSNQKLTYFDNNLIKLLDGSYPKNKNDVIVSSNSGKKINDIIKININNHTFNLKVVGVYDVNNQNFPFNDLFDNSIRDRSFV